MRQARHWPKTKAILLLLLYISVSLSAAAVYLYKYIYNTRGYTRETTGGKSIKELYMMTPCLPSFLYIYFSSHLDILQYTCIDLFCAVCIYSPKGSYIMLCEPAAFLNESVNRRQTHTEHHLHFSPSLFLY